MTRTVLLPNRRCSIEQTVTHKEATGTIREYVVGFGFDKDDVIRECFCSSPKDGSDMQAQISDACIAMSLLLQSEWTMAELASAFGENRAPGEKTGPPASALGAVARAGAALEVEVGKWPVLEMAARA